jgi:hypothetical protein
MIGLGALGAPNQAELLNLEPNASGFTAAFRMNHKNKGTTTLHVVSADGVIALVEVPQPARGVKETNAASFSIGLENHKLTGGTRRVASASGATDITERSGKTLILDGGWACVSEKLGFIAGPAGKIRYQAASNYNRRGAAEDTMEFVPEKPFAPRFAIWLPGKNAAATKKLASRVRWNVSDTNGALTFPTAKGKTQQLIVPLSAP